MGYYQGDYYGGTRGDPGFGSFFRRVASAAAGFIPGVGGFISKGIDALGRRGGSQIVRAFPGVGSIERVGQSAGRVIMKHPILTGAGAAGVIGLGSAAIGHHMGVAGRSMKGFHISKKTGREVRNRRMNVCNSRALRRAIRRAHGFERLAKHVIGFSSPRKPKGHMYFKRKRKAR